MSGPRRLSHWLGPLLLVPVVLALVMVLNQPRTERLNAAREALAEAGYPDARLNHVQTTSQMTRCEVGQIKGRGYAYAWRNAEHNGLYCLRQDGRPNRIIVD